MIMMDTKKNPEIISTSNLAFIVASKSNIKYLKVENRKMEKNLEVARQHIQYLHLKVQKVAPA